MQNRTGKCRTSRTMLDQAGAGRSMPNPSLATGSNSGKGRPTTLASHSSTDRSSYSGDSSRKLTMSCFYSLPMLSAQLPTAKLPAQHAKPLVPASLQNQAWSWLPEGPCPTLTGRCLIGYLTLSDKTTSHSVTLFLKTQNDGSWSSLPPHKKFFSKSAEIYISLALAPDSYSRSRYLPALHRHFPFFVL